MSSTQMIAAAHDEYLTAQFASLPPLPAVEKLSNTVWRILGGNPGKVIAPTSIITSYIASTRFWRPF